MSSTTKEELKNFYKAYAAWLNAGAPDYKPFSRHEGLCYALRMYAEDQGFKPLLRVSLREELDDQFNMKPYPFNIDRSHYARECLAGEVHRNLVRVDWVRKHAKD